MDNAQECVAKYRRLLQLLDEETCEMSRGVQGEILEAYLRILEQERDILKDAMKSMQSIL